MRIDFFSSVLEAGLEPARPKGHRILSPACLPIPPLEHKLIGLISLVVFLESILRLSYFNSLQRVAYADLFGEVLSK